MRLLLDGKIPSKEELLADDLVKQMIDEAKAEVVKTIPTKEVIVQALTVDELKTLEPVKQMINTAEETGKKAVDKTAILQSITAEDLKDNPVVEKIITEKLTQAKFTAEMIQAGISGKPFVAQAEGGEGTVSASRQIYNYLGAGAVQ